MALLGFIRMALMAATILSSCEACLVRMLLLLLLLVLFVGEWLEEVNGPSPPTTTPHHYEQHSQGGKKLSLKPIHWQHLPICACKTLEVTHLL